MSRMEFLSIEPIRLTILGKEVLLFPKCLPNRKSVFQSLALEFAYETQLGTIRLTGTLKLAPWKSELWIDTLPKDPK